jgi:hypothetical protein
MLRAFDWRDLPTLHRYRNQGLCLDAALEVTRGSALVPGVLLSYLSPATGIYTWVCADECDEQPLMGQVVHTIDATFARITFLAPIQALESPSILELLDRLAQQAGEREAFNLLAEIDEGEIAFETLRKAGFAIFARQRIWRVNNRKPAKEIYWRVTTSKDAFVVQALYHNVVPGLVQQVEPLSSKHLNGLVSLEEQDVVGYADLKYGPRGIWVHPYIHPDVEDIDLRLHSMLQSIPDKRSRSIYICVRTYQSWLEPALDEMGADPGPMQAVMVKRLAVQQRVTRPFALPAIEGQPEASAPIAQSRRNP